MKLLLKKSLRDFKANLLPNICVFALAFAGTFFFGGLNSVGATLDKSVGEFYTSQNLASYTIANDLDYAEYAALKDALNANHDFDASGKFSNGRIVVDGATQLDAVTLKLSVNRNVEISLFPQSDFPVNTPLLVEGRMPEEPLEALIDEAFARENGVKAGDTLTVPIEGDEYDILIVGSAIFPDHLYKGDAIPQIAETGIIKVFWEGVDVNTLYVETDLCESELRSVLTALSGKSFFVCRFLSREENVSVVRVRSDIRLITSLIRILPIVCLISLCLILYVNMTKRAEDEGYDIGVMSANGVKKMQIIFAVMLPYIVNVFFAGLLGTILGLTVLPNVYLRLLSRFYTLPAAKLGGIGISLVAFAGLVGAATLSLFVALMSVFKKTPSALMRGLHKSTARVMKSARVPITIKLSLRNFISYKKKSIFTVLSVSLCLGLIMTSFMLDDSVSALQNTVYGKYYNYDYTIGWNEGDKLDYDEVAAMAEESGLFDNLMFCLEFPSRYDGKNTLVSIVDDANPCYKIEGLDKGVCVPASYGDIDSVKFTVYSAVPFELELPVSSTYKDIGMFGIVVPLSAIKVNYPLVYAYMTSGTATKLYLHRKEGADVEGFSDLLSERFGVAFMCVEHSVDSDRFSQLFTVVDVTELLLTIVCGIMMAVLILNLSTLSLNDRMRDQTVFKALGVGGRKLNLINSLENAFSVAIAYLLAFPIGALLAGKIIKAVAKITGIVAYLGLTATSALILLAFAALFSAAGNALASAKAAKIDLASALKIKE